MIAVYFESNNEVPPIALFKFTSLIVVFWLPWFSNSDIFVRVYPVSAIVKESATIFSINGAGSSACKGL